MNVSVICLLPKQHPPKDMSQFFPICLSNVLIKIISKIIANRVKRVIGDLVGDTQASFTPGRQATYNIVIAQEVLHSMRTSQSKRRGMIVKIDLEKAYGSIDWKFLEYVLQVIGFGEQLINTKVSHSNGVIRSLEW